MKTKTLFASLLLFSMLFTIQVSFGQLPRETEAQKAERMKWWTDCLGKDGQSGWYEVCCSYCQTP